MAGCIDARVLGNVRGSGSGSGGERLPRELRCRSTRGAGRQRRLAGALVGNGPSACNTSRPHRHVPHAVWRPGSIRCVSICAWLGDTKHCSAHLDRLVARCPVSSAAGYSHRVTASATASGVVGGAPVEVLRLFLLPLFAMCLGWALHNDTAYDFTALWVHVTGGLPGRADRAGRAIPTLVTGTIVSLVGALLLGLALHDQVTAIGVFAVSIAVLGTTVGGSSIMSTVAPYPVARPGDSPFSQPVRSWGSAVVWQPFALLIEVALCLPVAWLAWQAITGQSVADAWLAAAAGFGTAAVAITIGILVGGRIFESRRTALLTFAQSY